MLGTGKNLVPGKWHSGTQTSILNLIQVILLAGAHNPTQPPELDQSVIFFILKQYCIFSYFGTPPIITGKHRNSTASIYRQSPIFLLLA